MPEESLVKRFETVVQSVQEPIVRRYLEEAYRCFVAEAYNGAVVMAWNAASRYLRLAAETISVSYFGHNYRILFGQSPPSELWRINDNLFIQTCQRMGVLGAILADLEKQRNRRNSCAHPSDTFILADEALELLESLRNVVSRRADDECLTDRPTVREFIKAAGEQEGRAIAKWVQEDLCEQLTHDLLTMYFDEEVENVSGIMGLWQGLCLRIGEQQKVHLWNRLERAVHNVLQDEQASRTPEEMVEWIVWPAPDTECEGRDRIGEHFINWFEQHLEDDTYDETDMKLARIVSEYMPTSLRECIETLRKEMARRLAE